MTVLKRTLCLSQTTSVVKAVKKENNMRGWQGHVLTTLSRVTVDEWSGDDKAVTFHDPSSPQITLFLCHHGCQLPRSFDLWQEFYKIVEFSWCIFLNV